MLVSNLLRLFPAVRRSLSADDNTDDSVDTSNSDTQVVILLFLFLGLALGVIIQQLMTRTTSAIVNAVPYTVVMFLIGMGLAAYSQVIIPYSLFFLHSYAHSYGCEASARKLMK